MNLCRIVVILLMLGMIAEVAGAQDTPQLRIGRITVENTDIFSAEEVANVRGAERTLRKVMNGLHINTREHILRRELLFATGDVYDPARLAETERNLRRIGTLNNVHVVAVDTLDDGTVDVLVSARESWSLQATLGYSLSSGGEQRWNVKLAERNFLGYGVTLGAGVGGDENRSYWNAFFRHRRVMGSDIGLGFDYSESDDGHFKRFYVERQFLSQQDPWSARFIVEDLLNTQRWYLSNAGPAGDDPARDASLYTRLPVRVKGGAVTLLIRLNNRHAHHYWRLGPGLRITDTHYALGDQSLLSDGRVEDLTWLQEPYETMSRDEGRRVYPYVGLQYVGTRWTKSRFVLQYGPVEDVLLSTRLDLRVGPAGGRVGSTTAWGRETWRAEGALVHWWRFNRSHILFQFVGHAQTGSEEVRQHGLDAVVGWMAQSGSENAPWQLRVFAEAAQGDRLNGTGAYVLGLDRGLRTLDFDGMAGDRLARWNVEGGKATPWEVLGLFRMGGAVFYDGGRAWWHNEEPGLGLARHEVGCGLRFGPIRTASSHTARIDISWALDGSVGPVLTAITSGRF